MTETQNPYEDTDKALQKRRYTNKKFSARPLPQVSLHRDLTLRTLTFNLSA